MIWVLGAMLSVAGAIVLAFLCVGWAALDALRARGGKDATNMDRQIP